MASPHSAAIAVAAARLIVEEGLEYGAAKRRAARDPRLDARSRAPARHHERGEEVRASRERPGTDDVEDGARTYLDLSHADPQPAELVELRRIAAVWMERLAEF